MSSTQPTLRPRVVRSVRSVGALGASLLATSSILLMVSACVSNATPNPSSGDTALTSPSPKLDALAERYVRLVLAVGEHDPNFVDAYYGPAGWREEVHAEALTLATIRTNVETLARDLAAATPDEPTDELTRLRHRYLVRQLAAVGTRVAMLAGEKLSFDRESQALYDAVAPSHTEADFDAALAELDALLPGDGDLPSRLQTLRNAYAIPKERVDAVFRAAIDECRARTAKHFALPAGETFTVEYVQGKPWSAYNWYQGGSKSVIQVNDELPILIDRAIDLACHEGYPGHHVYNALLEQHLVRERGFVELSVYPLFSPQSLIAEGTANYGIEVAFPGDERARFEREVLYPLAGLDPRSAERYDRALQILHRLDYAGNEAARRYLDGHIDAATAADWLVRYALMSPVRAQQRVGFFDTYRSYVINYNLGRDLVRAYVERESGGDPNRRWQVFEALLSSPRLPSDLR